MANPIPVRSDLLLNLNQLMSAVLEKLGSDPGSPSEAQVWFNTGSGRIKFHDGSSVTFVVSPTSTDTLTNKSINADNNTITNLTPSNIAAASLSSNLSTGTSSQLATADIIYSAIQSAIATADVLAYKGSIDCSTNPNYPAADAGDSYLISVAGKIGGVSGPSVEQGDLLVCQTDSTASGDHATVGSDWFVMQRNLEAASTTTAGFVRLATEAETQTGTADDIAVTPAGLDSVGYLRSYVATFSASTGGTITAATHGLGVNTKLTAELYEDGSPNTKSWASIQIDHSTGAVTWGSNQTITGHVLITGT